MRYFYLVFLVLWVVSAASAAVHRQYGWLTLDIIMIAFNIRELTKDGQNE